MNTDARVLLVDDEPNLLDGLRRQLRDSYHVDTASNPERALELLAGGGNYQVIVSDMRMPGLNGADLLEQVRRKHPEIVRVMLTGNADQETAAQAVNRGNVFKFVNKPVSLEELNHTLAESLAQYRVLKAERDLLQNTLAGAVKMLTEVLSSVDNAAFGVATQLRDRVRLVAKTLALSNAWELELAAMLANLGRVIVPSTVAEKLRRKEALTSEEAAVVERAPEVGRNLIGHIPRLEGVASMVLYHRKNFDGSGFPRDGVKGEDIPLGARLLRVLSDLAEHERAGCSTLECLQKMSGSRGSYDEALIDDLKRILSTSSGQRASAAVSEDVGPVTISWRELQMGQKLIDDVYTRSGILLIHAGSVVTSPILERLQNYAKLAGLKEPLKVDRKSPPVMN